jgi:NAD(P)-dependent dehydrogenase (short-subunit alcohol dehydrogenase family)
VDRLADSFPSPHDLAVVDVARGAQVQKWAMRLLGRHGAPDLLLNNAALINRNAPLWEVTAEEFDAVIDVNIKGVANVLRSFLPAMMARGRGAIVNFSSGWGREPAPEVAPYCATKFAMEGLTGALAQELPHGLAAVALNPGIIATDMLRSCFGPSAEDYPSPEKWSRWAAPFLLKLGRKDNGQSLTIPGSMT